VLRRCAHSCALQWLVELAPQFYQAADPNKMTRQKRMQKIEPLYDRCARALCCAWPAPAAF
jgi:hypothetical protein